MTPTANAVYAAVWTRPKEKEHRNVIGTTRDDVTRLVRAFSVLTVMAAMALAVLVAPGSNPALAQGATPSVAVTSISPGDVVTGATLDIVLEVEDFAIDCAKSGHADEDGIGHIHVMLDGMTMANLVGFYCSDSFSISTAGLAAGPHSLIVGLSTNSHLPLMDTFQMIGFDFQPENPVALPEANFTGAPGVELVSKLDGETVGSVVTIELKGINFTASEDFMGKGNVPGYGHWHVFVDTDMSGMMGMDDSSSTNMDAATPEAEMDSAGMDGMAMMPMLGMVAMPGTDTFEIDLSAWGPGEHTIWIEPVQNDHTQYEEFGWVEFTVTVDSDA